MAIVIVGLKARSITCTQYFLAAIGYKHNFT